MLSDEDRRLVKKWCRDRRNEMDREIVRPTRIVVVSEWLNKLRWYIAETEDEIGGLLMGGPVRICGVPVVESHQWVSWTRTWWGFL